VHADNWEGRAYPGAEGMKRKPSHYARRALPPLDPALESELREQIALGKLMATEAAKHARGEAPSAMTKRDQAWLRKKARQLDKLNASIKDERLAAVAAELREEAADLLEREKSGVKRIYPYVFLAVMDRLTESGLPSAAAARHTERLLSYGSANSIQTLWRRHRNANK
jgi:hypothetical protein